MKKEVDIILLIVFIALFFSFGFYLAVNEEGTEKNIKSDSVMSAVENAEEIPREDSKIVIEPIKDAIEEMPTIVNNIVTIEIKDTEFNPKEINISVGTTVLWVNKDLKRNYKIYDRSISQKFRSPQIQPNNSFNYTFSEVGIYNYNDAIFTYMKGVIRVE